MLRNVNFMFFFLMSITAMSQKKTELFNWRLLNKIPDAVGFAGAFAGISNGVLLVAGGANFPGNSAPWLGTEKVWHDKIFALKNTSADWEIAGVLPKPLGYGVSITTLDGLIIIGGSNKDGHCANVDRLIYKGGKIEIQHLPSLPFPLANSCGALVGQTIYVCGGLERPDDRETKNVFLALELEQLNKGWRQLPALPGPSRMLSVAASLRGEFYLISGTELVKGNRKYLKDCYKYNFKTGWTQLQSLPYSTVAAPTPAFTAGNNIYVFGGDDGGLVNSDLREKHPGFSTNILSFNIKNSKWEKVGNIPVTIKPDAVQNPNGSLWAPVTTPLVKWDDTIILPGGEVRPATRTPNIIEVSVLK